MFTGLIEEVGELEALHLAGDSGTLTIACRKVLEGTRIGDSIAVDGICLTATHLGASYFTADVTRETVTRSNLKDLPLHAPVNLERAMRADGRFGGHIVTGHIDGTGTICSLEKEGNGVRVHVEAPEKLMRQIAEKGSVAIDGISLTVAAVTDHDFSVAVIPHTGAVTTLLTRKPGDVVNLETDVLAKYVARLLHFAPKEKEENSTEQLTMQDLIRLGF